MNTMFQTFFLISAIFATLVILTMGMYRRFAFQPLAIAYQQGRMQLIIIFVIGLITATVGNVFKNPFTNENIWLLAKDTILIMLALHLIILLANGLLVDIYHKKIPANALHITAIVTGILAVASSTILSQGNPHSLKWGVQLGGITFLVLTALFFALLMTGIIIRIAKRMQ